MTTIKPCRLCPIRAGCEKKEAFKKSVRGLGLRAATFRCDILASELRKGRRIQISQPFLTYETGWDNGETTRIQRETMSATITNVYPDHQFTCTVDKADFDIVSDMAIDAEKDVNEWMKKRFRRRQPHIRIVAFLDEPDQKVCENGNVGPFGGCDTLGDCLCKQWAELGAPENEYF
jgi:hypothetical protein